jgi:hypothetical protein
VASKRRWRRVSAITTPYLKPGESIGRFAFAQTLNPLWSFLSVPIYVILGPFHASPWPFIVLGVVLVVFVVLGLTVLTRTGRIVVITDRRVLVWATVGLLGRREEFLRELPRGTVIGARSGNWWNSFDTLGERLYLPPRAWGGKEKIGARD